MLLVIFSSQNYININPEKLSKNISAYPMIHAQTSELRRAFNIHRSLANPLDSNSHYLILFYAIECGLKYAYLRENRFSSTDQDREKFEKYRHDITGWLAELRIPRQRLSLRNNFHYKQRNGQSPIKEIHEAWRYGILINEDDEDEIVSTLKKLESWIEENWS